MAIVTSTYRYKRPPRKRKPRTIEGSAIVTPVDPKKSRRRRDETAAAELGAVPPPGGADEAAMQSTTAGRSAGRDRSATPQPANDDRKSAIVTARKPGSRFSTVPDLTPEEHKRRGDAADALFREMKRRVTAAARTG